MTQSERKSEHRKNTERENGLGLGRFSPHVTPTEYLDYARRDMLRRDNGGLVDALKNVKSAIDSQFDILLETFGLLKLSERQQCPFPRKIEVLNRLDIVAPRVLKKVNQGRIELEHYHRRPDREEVLDFLDIADQFVEPFRRRALKVEFCIDYDNDFALLMDSESEKVFVYNSTKKILEAGGGHMFREFLQEQKPAPLVVASVSSLDEWIDVCKRFLPTATELLR